MAIVGVKQKMVYLQGYVERLIPPFIYRYLYCQRGGVEFSKRALMVTKPMTWEAFCYYWVPILFPDVKQDLESDSFPPSYKKACVTLLSSVFEITTESAQRLVTYENFREGLPPSYGQLLRKTHMLWTINTRVTLPRDFLDSICK